MASVFFPWVPSDYPLGNYESHTRLAWEALVARWTHSLAFKLSDRIVIARVIVGPRCSWKVLHEIRLQEGQTRNDKTLLAWAVDMASMEPLLLFTGGSVVYVWNLAHNAQVGVANVHGGDISCITVCSRSPSLFSTASRDHSIIFWTLVNTDSPSSHSLHGNRGPPFHLFTLEGGHSGGHDAPITSIAFHPSRPLVATCSLDRTVRIWYFPFFMLEDGNTFGGTGSAFVLGQPIFGTGIIHSGPLSNVLWLNDTTLITQSTASPEKNGGQAGTLVIWKWLSSDRFRPRTTGTGDIGDILMRGTITERQWYDLSPFPIPLPPPTYNAASFQIILEVDLPQPCGKCVAYASETSGLSLFLPGRCHITYCSCGDLFPVNGSLTDLDWKRLVVRKEDPHPSTELTTCSFSPDGRYMAVWNRGLFLWEFDQLQDKFGLSLESNAGE